MRNFVLWLLALVCLPVHGVFNDYIYTNEYGCVVGRNQNPLEETKKYRMVYAVDSLLLSQDKDLSPEQRAMKLKLMYVDAFLTDVEGNCPRLTVGEEYFIANGIPVKYYHDLVAKGKETAEMMARNNFPHDMEGSRKYLRELYPRFFKETAATGVFFEDFYRKLIRDEFLAATPADSWYEGPVPEVGDPTSWTSFDVARFCGSNEREMSAEDLAIKRKLEYVRKFCAKVVDNRTVFTVGKDYFRENGIPEEYFDQLVAWTKQSEDMADCADMESFGKTRNRAKFLEQDRKFYAAFLEENKKTGILYEDFMADVVARRQAGEKFPWED